MISAIYAVPIFNRVLLHAPLAGLTTLVNRAAAQSLASGIKNQEEVHPNLKSIFGELMSPSSLSPLRQKGLINPAFLGLIPTRSCNMACLYCDFQDDDLSLKMPISLARQAIDAYLEILKNEKLT